MAYFIREDKQPSAATLNIIRQVAYSYRVANINGRNEAYSLN